ncbi:MAG TPA: hypothetical protein VLK58_27870, partial [Conexibacter sp.]|nr:hypothetical protein [Conexibacter sp.]
MGLALLALVAPGAATAADETPVARSIERIELGGEQPTATTAGPDGRIWTFVNRMDGATRVDELVRLTAAGVESRAAVGTPLLGPLGPLVPLTDGRVGWVREARDGDGQRSWQRSLVRGGGPIATAPLPANDGAPDEVALAPDGSAWRLFSCTQIERIAPDGSVRTWEVDDRCVFDTATALVFGGDGSAWAANACWGRVTRVSADGLLRRWRFRGVASACSGELDSGPRSVALPTDAGGLSFAFNGGGIRIGPRGKLVPGLTGLLDVATPDGSTWSLTGTGALRRRAAAGAVNEIADPGAGGRGVTSATIGPDERLWFARATSNGGTKAAWQAEQISIGETSATGPARTLDGQLRRAPAAWAFPSLTAGPDGAIWISDTNIAPGTVEPRLPNTPQALMRVVPNAPVAAGAQARPQRIVARSGPIAWLQVRCDAAPGRFCTAAATIARRGSTGALASRVPAVVPGGMS